MKHRSVALQLVAPVKLTGVAEEESLRSRLRREILEDPEKVGDVVLGLLDSSEKLRDQHAAELAAGAQASTAIEESARSWVCGLVDVARAAKVVVDGDDAVGIASKVRAALKELQLENANVRNEKLALALAMREVRKVLVAQGLHGTANDVDAALREARA